VLATRHALTISEAADDLGVTPSWLRFGERLGALPLARRTPAGWRYYTSEDLERLRRLGVGQRKKQLEERAREQA
jgi:DNA-binding transcriptional MerR regulator